ncbi:hypothetical protein C8F01DRAFT_1088778 [Mycena amicta]|nr:hypothetical protein C8F01DRAFT_1088778 [Mycena amicta]
MERRPHTMERPTAGRLRSSLLSTSMAILTQAFVFAFTLAFLLVGLGWTTTESLVWFWVGLGLGLGIGNDEGWVRRRWWKEGRWRWEITAVFGDALGATIYWLFIAIPAVVLGSSSTTFSQIAARIHFPWSPDLARAGLIVFGVGGCISAFTYAVSGRVLLPVRVSEPLARSESGSWKYEEMNRVQSTEHFTAPSQAEQLYGHSACPPASRLERQSEDFSKSSSSMLAGPALIVSHRDRMEDPLYSRHTGSSRTSLFPRIALSLLLRYRQFNIPILEIPQC